MSASRVVRASFARCATRNKLLGHHEVMTFKKDSIIIRHEKRLAFNEGGRGFGLAFGLEDKAASEKLKIKTKTLSAHQSDSNHDNSPLKNKTSVLNHDTLPLKNKTSVLNHDNSPLKKN